MSQRPHSSRSRYAEVAGTRLHLQEWGAGPTLLCVHGLGGGGHFFGGVGPALAGACHTVAVDLPGSGLSPAVPAFSFEAAASIVTALARRERWQPVSLLGHSMGAIIGLEAVREAPDLVRTLILVGGLPEPQPAARSRITDRISGIRRAGLIGIGEQAVAANFSRRTRAERPELTGLFARLFEVQSAEGYIAAAEALCGWSARPLPPLDHVRCLVVTGDEDLYAPPDAVRAFARTLPAGSRVEVMRDCGHLPFLEQPLAFAEVVRRFLRPER